MMLDIDENLVRYPSINYPLLRDLPYQAYIADIKLEHQVNKITFGKAMHVHLETLAKQEPDQRERNPNAAALLKTAFKEKHRKEKNTCRTTI